MAVVHTKLPPGKHVVQGKSVDLTRDRIGHFVDTFQSLKSQGVEFGVPWGHFGDAAPDQKLFLHSKLNAGYVKDIKRTDDGGMNISLDCPSLSQGPDGTLLGKVEMPDGTKVETVIKEVSPGIWPSWTDGKGVTHKDLIGHVSLTVMPIIADQAGFQALSANLPDGVIYFSTELSTMTDEKKDKSGDDTKKLGDDLEKVAGDEDGDGDEDDLDSILKGVGGNAEEERCQRLIAMLAQAGAVLPPDTDCDNFDERLETALGTMLAAQAAKAAAKAKEEAENKPVQPGGINEESGPATNMMMSTLIKENPTVRNLMDSHLKDRRAKRALRIDALKLRGLPGVVETKLRGAKVYLSTIVADDGSLTDDETDRTLTILEQCLPGEEWAKTYLSTIANLNAKEINPPLRDDEPTEKRGNLMVTKEQAALIDQATASRA